MEQFNVTAGELQGAFTFLGLSVFATEQEIRRQMRRRARQCHPDKVAGQMAQWHELQRIGVQLLGGPGYQTGTQELLDSMRRHIDACCKNHETSTKEKPSTRGLAVQVLRGFVQQVLGQSPTGLDVAAARAEVEAAEAGALAEAAAEAAEVTDALLREVYGAATEFAAAPLGRLERLAQLHASVQRGATLAALRAQGHTLADARLAGACSRSCGAAAPPSRRPTRRASRSCRLPWRATQPRTRAAPASLSAVC